MTKQKNVRYKQCWRYLMHAMRTNPDQILPWSVIVRVQKRTGKAYRW